MKRTSAGALVVAAVVGIGAGFLFDQLLTSGGRPTFTPMVSLPILLLVVGAVVLGLAIPIRRATRGAGRTPVNPFQALRVAMLAKASSTVGAVLGGVGLGLLVFVLTRPVAPSAGSVALVAATAVCGAILIAAALVAEHLCTIRKDDDDPEPGSTDAGADRVR
jgi:hypothetical protein